MTPSARDRRTPAGAPPVAETTLLWALRRLSSALAATADGRVRVATGLVAAFPGARAVGPAYCVTGTAGDNLALHEAIYEAPSASVIVAGLMGTASAGHWGELLSLAASGQGLAGLVVTGAIRDQVDVARHGFPVFHQGLDPRPASKVFPGRHGLDAQIADVTVNTGDFVCADVDGVAVVPADALAEVLVAAMALEQKEATIARRISAGETTLAILDLPRGKR